MHVSDLKTIRYIAFMTLAVRMFVCDKTEMTLSNGWCWAQNTQLSPGGWYTDICSTVCVSSKFVWFATRWRTSSICQERQHIHQFKYQFIVSVGNVFECSLIVANSVSQQPGLIESPRKSKRISWCELLGLQIADFHIQKINSHSFCCRTKGIILTALILGPFCSLQASIN